MSSTALSKASTAIFFQGIDVLWSELHSLFSMDDTLTTHQLASRGSRVPIRATNSRHVRVNARARSTARHATQKNMAPNQIIFASGWFLTRKTVK